MMDPLILGSGFYALAVPAMAVVCIATFAALAIACVMYSLIFFC